MFLPKAQETGGTMINWKVWHQMRTNSEQGSIFYLAPYSVLLGGKRVGNLLEQSKVICFVSNCRYVHCFEKDALNLQQAKQQKRANAKSQSSTQTGDLLPHKSRPNVCDGQFSGRNLKTFRKKFKNISERNPKQLEWNPKKSRKKSYKCFTQTGDLLPQKSQSNIQMCATANCHDEI